MRKNLSSLQLRVLSAVVLLPFVLGALYLGGAGFLMLTMLVGAVAMFEWAALVSGGKRNTPLFSLAVFAVLLGIFLAACFGMKTAVASLLSSALITGLAALILRRRDCAFLMAFGVAYIGLALAGIVWLRQEEYGFEMVLFLALVVWAGDVFAYFSGRAIGGPKLAPKVSPNKTWAGLWGGAAGSGVVAVLTLLCFPYILQPNTPTLIFVGAVGAIMTLVGQAGDLFISALKRHYGVKDTGTLIPGHGGVLDRIDALLLVTLFFLSFLLIFTLLRA